MNAKFYLSIYTLIFLVIILMSCSFLRYLEGIYTLKNNCSAIIEVRYELYSTLSWKIESIISFTTMTPSIDVLGFFNAYDKTSQFLTK